MDALFRSDSQRHLINVILGEMERVGYRGELVERSYSYPDRFASRQRERRIDAALFGRSPKSYETALFGIAAGNGVPSDELVNEHRSLGAPVVLEVQEGRVGVWTIGRDPALTRRQHALDEGGIRAWIAQHERSIRPLEFLRTKDFGLGAEFFQHTLFAGLIPELEDEITGSLDPILRRAFKAGIDSYRRTTDKSPPEGELFKLGFWLLTGKVFADRGHEKFADLNILSDPDTVLDRVARHYKESIKGLLNRPTREAIFDGIWDQMDFRHISVEVLSQIWSKTLVSRATRKRLGIHRTRKSIVRYIIDRIPFEQFAPEDRRVIEPCSGNAAFLVASLDRMREIPPVMDDPVARHAYKL